MDTTLLNTVLNYFYERKTEQIVQSSIKNEFGCSEVDFYRSVRKIRRDVYLDMMSIGNIASQEDNLYQINDPGLDFEEAGGYQPLALPVILAKRQITLLLKRKNNKAL